MIFVGRVIIEDNHDLKATEVKTLGVFAEGSPTELKNPVGISFRQLVHELSKNWVF